MILCPLADFPRYAGLHPAFPRIVEALAHLDLDTLPEGRTELAGDDLFVLASPVARTRPAAEAQLEVHRRFVDVQVILRGTDRMAWAPLGACRDEAQAYDAERDIAFFHDAPAACVDVPAGHLAVFFPEDAHAPLIGAGETVHKLVFKARV